MSITEPKTLLEAVRFYSDLNVCHAYMVKVKWPDGDVTCPRCGSDHVGFISTRMMFQCKGCRRQFSVKVGTIFEDSPLGLDKWFVAVWCITNAKNGISSCELARALGVTQKSAWHMLHRVREAMRSGTLPTLAGTVESDETYVGGKASNMHKSRRERTITGTGGSGKTVVHGMLQRTDETCASMVVADVVPNCRRSTLQPRIEQTVARGSAFYTDTLASYRSMNEMFGRNGYKHGMVDHSVGFVQGNVHTNGLENFWSTLKRCLGGTYIAVRPQHLFRYLGEQVYRFNFRTANDSGRFHHVMRKTAGNRLTWKQLTAKTFGHAGSV